MQRTLIIVKPDAVQRGLIGGVLSRLEARGLKLVGLKLIAVDEALARRHYGVHEGKPFFPGLIQYITSSPVVVGVFEGPEAVAVVRATVGATNPVAAAPGTIRGDWALEIGRNLIHASDSPETAATEVALFFRPEELVTYERATDRWILE
ncbi:MAG TPA: nucleoside-diphosphate kinase [Chloroflexota bacterium]|nr:nucleoside-diphosphate kinase [Chloroflexota bacterium]